VKRGIVYMPDRAGHQRTHRESEAFKSEIIKLRSQNKSIVEIAKELNVTKQYVSLVLREAGLGARVGNREKRLAEINDQMRGQEEELEKQVSLLEEQGEYTLANWLRLLARRNPS
jgi:hypothetical protein